ncbi:hypothetical protein BH23CHL1_BH23CHL1_07760 [soil metagenome]
MPTVRYRSLIPAPAEELFDWHARPGAFERLVPPWQKVEIVFRDGSIRDGDRLGMDLKAGPFRKRWLALHSDFVEGEQFRDTQVEGPFRRWIHTHRVHPAGAAASVLDDEVEYELPGGTPAAMLGTTIASQQIRRMFRFRHLRTRNDLLRHEMYRDRERIQVTIVGSGHLVAQLGALLTGGGHTVVENGQADFVVDLSHLSGENPVSRVDVGSGAMWISVLPLSSDSFSALRFPRHMTIWTPAIVGVGSSNPLSRAAMSLQNNFRGVGNDTKIHWLAEDDLLGVIHKVMMERGLFEDVMARAPTLAFASEVQKATGHTPFDGETAVPEAGFHYLYPTFDNAVAAMNGRL